MSSREGANQTSNSSNRITRSQGNRAEWDVPKLRLQELLKLGLHIQRCKSIFWKICTNKKFENSKVSTCFSSLLSPRIRPMKTSMYLSNVSKLNFEEMIESSSEPRHFERWYVFGFWRLFFQSSFDRQLSQPAQNTS